MNGEQIPYGSLGFSSLETLLLSSRKFIIQNRGNDKIVQVLPTSKTQHLADLIKKQKLKPPKKVSVSVTLKLELNEIVCKFIKYIIL